MTTARHTTRALIAVATALILAACAPSATNRATPSQGAPSYKPIADKELYEQIAALKGVTEVDLSYVDRFGAANYYTGRVEITDDSDPEALLDQIIAILRQGKFNAGVDSVGIARVNGSVQSGPDFGIPIDRLGITERYGRQPGDGVPPGKDRLPTQSPPAPIR